ncbi:MAG: hypothetical protein GC146_00575 [Limimaricola sp.]|nr:hypothetical protein [Limimaricola sp.]
MDQSRWPEFLEQLHIRSGGVRTHLFGRDNLSQKLFAFMGHGYDPVHMKDYNSHYRHLNAWVPGFQGSASGTLMSPDEMMPYEKLKKTEFYDGWVLPQGDISAGVGGMVFNQGDRFIAFGGHIRRSDQDRLEKPFHQMMQLLLPHVQQAFEISRAMVARAVDFHLAQMDSGPGSAAILVDQDRKVVHLSMTAALLLEQGNTIRLDRSGRIEFVDRGAALEFDRAIHGLATADPNYSSSFPLRSATPGLGYICRTGRIVPGTLGESPFGALFTGDTPALLLAIQPRAWHSTTLHERLREHGLTQRETQVALRVADGRSLSDIADADQLSIHTIRNQLKSAMSKLGVNRQAQLAKLLASWQQFNRG